jgi:aldose sugar dehydrogenase
MKSRIASHWLLWVLFLGLIMVQGCARTRSGPGGSGAADGGTIPPGLKVESVLGGLSVPWSIAFTPEQDMIFTERPGRVSMLRKGSSKPEVLAVIPDVEQRSESGLMGLTLHPDYATNRLLYLAYAYAAEAGQRVKVVRMREEKGKLTDAHLILDGIPAAPFHAGCRLRFGPDGKLYITTGDATQPPLAQRLDSLAGKTLRINDDGSVPEDNPFVGQSGVRPEIWSLGHRNAQGLDFQPGTGLMFQTEHGPSGNDGPGGGDEVNIVKKGGNYGWPIIHHRQDRLGLEPPLLEYTPAVAPASGMFYSGKALPDFNDNFFFGCLRGEAIIRVVLDGANVVRQDRLFTGQFGRIREVAQGPDGAIYFSTSNRDGRGSPAADDDRILRIVPSGK